MKSFQKRRRLRYIIQSKPFLIFLGVFIFVFIFSVFDFMNKMEKAIKNRKIIEDKIIELEKSKEKLNSDIVKLKTEEGIEENIRDKFGLAKEGENMILIIDDKNLSEVEENINSKGFFSFLKNWFK